MVKARKMSNLARGPIFTSVALVNLKDLILFQFLVLDTEIHASALWAWRARGLFG